MIVRSPVSHIRRARSSRASGPSPDPRTDRPTGQPRWPPAGAGRACGAPRPAGRRTRDRTARVCGQGTERFGAIPCPVPCLPLPADRERPPERSGKASASPTPADRGQASDGQSPTFPPHTAASARSLPECAAIRPLPTGARVAAARDGPGQTGTGPRRGTGGHRPAGRHQERRRACRRQPTGPGPGRPRRGRGSPYGPGRRRSGLPGWPDAPA